MHFQLSASKLNLLRDCERCFWDTYRGDFKRPFTPFATVMNGIDRVAKAYIDQYRVQHRLPPDLEGKVTGLFLPDLEIMQRWRHWQSGLKANLTVGTEHTVQLIGALDDVIVTPGPTIEAFTYTPADIKTKGDLPKDSGKQYYQVQCDCYGLLLTANRYATSGKAYLIYLYPVACLTGSNGIPIQFGSQVFELESKADRAVELIDRAIDVLTGPRPRPHPACDFCRYGTGYGGED